MAHLTAASRDAHTLHDELVQEMKQIDERQEKIKSEQYYQEILEQMTGYTHSENDFGVTDITTPTSHIEIKHWCNFKSALGQLLAYSLSDPKESLYVYFFGESPHNRSDIVKLFIYHSIQVYHFNEDDTLEKLSR